ncbi:hypothetical protein [Rhodoferax sp.]|uniref:hypothetical protein n=1 Tax=Rhodoferax sp. TaxID=50421 RepID=UPI0027367773|nr:hypothetical protein [Rhodoferax sp.]
MPEEETNGAPISKDENKTSLDSYSDNLPIKVNESIGFVLLNSSVFRTTLNRKLSTTF